MCDRSDRWLCLGIRKVEWERGTAEVYSEGMTSVEHGNRHVEELRVTHGNMCGCYIEFRKMCTAIMYTYANGIVNIQTRECFSDNNSRYVSFGWTCCSIGWSRVIVEVRI